MVGIGFTRRCVCVCVCVCVRLVLLEVTTAALSGNRVTQWRELKSLLCDMKSADLKEIFGVIVVYSAILQLAHSAGPGCIARLYFDRLKRLFQWLSACSGSFS